MQYATNTLPAAEPVRTPLEQADASLSNTVGALHAFIDELQGRLERVMRPAAPEPANKAIQQVGPSCSEIVARLNDTRERLESAEARLRSIADRLDV